jgi:hypothetical protein
VIGALSLQVVVCYGAEFFIDERKQYTKRFLISGFPFDDEFGDRLRRKLTHVLKASKPKVLAGKIALPSVSSQSHRGAACRAQRTGFVDVDTKFLSHFSPAFRLYQ